MIRKGAVGAANHNHAFDPFKLLYDPEPLHGGHYHQGRGKAVGKDAGFGHPFRIKKLR